MVCFPLGYTTIGQGIGSTRVLSLVKSIMGEEIKPSLIAMNPEYEEYIDLFTISFIKRCRASFKDKCIRVGRDPLRKLQPDERVLGSIKMALAANVSYEKLLFGAACAIMYSVKQINPKDEEAEFVRQLFLKNNSAADVLTYTGEFKGIKCKGLDPQRDAEIIDGIEKAYEKLTHEIT